MFDFDATVLVSALRATFERRKTPLPADLPVALTPAFTTDTGKLSQWAAFLRRSDAHDAGSLADAIGEITTFAARPLSVAATGASWSATWPPGGPWTG